MTKNDKNVAVFAAALFYYKKAKNKFEKKLKNFKKTLDKTRMQVYNFSSQSERVLMLMEFDR